MNDIFRRNHCKTPEWIADLDLFSLKYLPHIVFTKSSGYQFSVYKFSLKAVSSRVINPLLTKLARTVLGEYRPSVCFVRTSLPSVRTVKTSGRYSPSTDLALG